MSKRKRRLRDREERKKSGVSVIEAAPACEQEAISGRGKKTIGGGVLLLILGFVVLTLTDSHGRNWASILSPLLILGAYGVIAYGIFLPDAVSCAADERGGD